MRSAVSFVVLAVGACATSPSAPAPVDYRTTAPTPPPPDATAPPQAPKPHPQTPPLDWADGPGTPLSTFALKPQDAQPYDPAALPRAHMVQAGDTLFAISTRYQIPLRALIDVNRLSAPFALAEGQVLSLPAPRFHRVQQGETLLAVARLYNIDARSLALLNRMASPYVVRPGDQLVLPALARASAAPPPRPAPPPGAVAASPKAAPPAGAIKFVWPFKGRVLAGFGPQVGGKRLDGVDIATPAGAPVQAAADGRVVYAGADLPGYGKLILVQHEGEWVTAYAHLGAFEAAEGARVKKGETIALAGPLKLHFQVRRRGEPTDPAPYLPPV